MSSPLRLKGPGLIGLEIRLDVGSWHAVEPWYSAATTRSFGGVGVDKRWHQVGPTQNRLRDMGARQAKGSLPLLASAQRLGMRSFSS